MRSHRPPAPAAARLGGGRSHGRGACRCGTGNGYAAGRAPRAPVSGSKLRPADATEERPRGTRDSPPARPPTHPKECKVGGGDIRRKGCTLAGARTYSSLAGTQQTARMRHSGISAIRSVVELSCAGIRAAGASLPRAPLPTGLPVKRWLLDWGTPAPSGCCALSGALIVGRYRELFLLCRWGNGITCTLA